VPELSIKYVFSINNGHSGSDYLTKLLSCAENTVSFHEGFPMMNGLPMQRFNMGKPKMLQELMPKKVAEIRRKTRNGAKVYCETNHSFTKGWGFLLPDRYISQESMAVIVLHRDLDQTVHSMLRCRSVPDSSEWARTWTLSPHQSFNVATPPESNSPYDLCEWHVRETYRRAELYEERFPNILYVHCTLDELNDYKEVANLFERLGLHATLELREVVGRPLNTRSEWPQLSVEELLRTTGYPSADELSSEDRDTVILAMVDYLRQRKANELASLRPDYAMGGTLVKGVVSLVANAQEELEDEFGYSLTFTEAGSILIFELLHSIDPWDAFFVPVKRCASPHIEFAFDFNQKLDAFVAVRKLGLVGGLKVLGLKARGVWSRDFSHRLFDISSDAVGE
jgi:hypothetical protein